MAGLPGLDGEGRQLVAKSLWRAWRHDGRGAAILSGISGVGKTERLIAPLVSRARDQKIIAVHVDVPAQPLDLERELLSRVSEAVTDSIGSSIAKDVVNATDLATGLKLVLNNGGLIVVDEFQRLLHPRSGAPLEPFSEQFARLARRSRDGGCLWLVSNRYIDPLWTEPFHVAILEAPTDTKDAIRIVMESIATADARARLPEARFQEVAYRFGGNPRALRLLGHMLRFYDLEELIGPARAISEGLNTEDLVNTLEHSLLAKAREGLSNAAHELLRRLAVLTEFAPMNLIEAMGAQLGNVESLLRQMHDRFLIEQRKGLRRVHPIVREVELPRLMREEKLYCSANRLAGKWYSDQVVENPNGGNEAALATNLASAHYHLTAANAHAELTTVLDSIRPYIERRFNWSARTPSSATDLNAQISLLEVFLKTPGFAAVEFHLGRLLQSRSQGDDLRKALNHAKRACVGQTFSHPWVLRLQIEYQLNGADAAVAVGREAIKTVDPAKSLFAVYQIVAAALSHAGEVAEAVQLCMEGAEHALHEGYRLIEEALFYAAAMPTAKELERIRDWISQREGFENKMALLDVLLDEHKGDWRGAAERARIERRRYPSFVHLALHEALCLLGANAPDEAQDALDRFPGGVRFSTRIAATWLAALVALRAGDVARGQSLTAIYLAAPAPASPSVLERMLIREWDTRVRTLGEANPALNFPILPPTLSGLSAPVIRPQHGPPVLPHYSSAALPEEQALSDKLRFLIIGTEWASGQGGLSTFNRQLCLALAAYGVEVACVVINASVEEIGQAAQLGVRLIAAKRTTGVEEREWLARRPTELGAGYTPDFIVGHGRITGPAALRLSEDSYPAAKRLHFVHMAPDEIEWHKLDREAPAGVRAEDRTRQELELGRVAHRVVAVGPRLYGRYARDLQPFKVPPPIRFDPGFDARENTLVSGPPPGPWKVLLLGRAEDYLLKGIDLAARALGRIAQARHQEWPEIELVVRGAKPADLDSLRQQLLKWAASPRLQVVVRAFTSDEETLDHDVGTASLVLMPSRREGFGLVALEAIVAGAPVLVSSRSGVAQLLRETLNSEHAARVIVETTGDEVRPETDVQEWERAIDGLLRDRDAAFRRAAELRDTLSARYSWRASVNFLLSSL